MIKMSRGYEDERLVLQVFLMFMNRADSQGRFGVLTYESEEIEYARMSEGDLRVLLMCTLYYSDKNVLCDYCLYDRSGAKPHQYRLDRKKDF